MKSNWVIINIYNNGYADIITEDNTEYVNKGYAESYILMIRKNNAFQECGYNHYKNGDTSYTFTKI